MNIPRPRLWVPVTIVCSLGLFAALFMILRHPISMDDGLRHVMMGRRMATEGILNVPGWSEWFFTGYLHEHPADPWFLSDALYAPLSRLPIASALAVFSVASIALLSAAFLLCLRPLRIGGRAAAVLLLLLLFGHPIFTFRLLIGRPFVLVSALSLLVLRSIFRRSPLLTGILLMILTLLSHLFIFPLGICGVAFLWLMWLGEKRHAYALAFWSFTGVILGILVHPASLDYVTYLWLILLRTPLLSLPDRGGEVFSGFGSGMTVYVLVGTAVLGQVLLMRGKRIRAMDPQIILLDVLALCFFAQFVLWARSIDFLWPILLLLVGAVCARDGVADKLRRLLLPERMTERAIVIGLLAWCTVSFGSIARTVIVSNRASAFPTTYENALENVPAGSRILNADWAVFPPLVAVRPDLRYAFGFDPAFTAVSNSGTYALLSMLRPTPYPAIQTTIDAHAWLLALLTRHPADYLLLVNAPETRPIAESLSRIGFRDVSNAPEIMTIDVRRMGSLLSAP